MTHPLPSTPAVVLYAADDLMEWTAKAFQAAGVRPLDAQHTARVLLRTSLRGIDTHGVVRVMPYIEKVRSGEVNAAPNISSQLRDGVLHFDGDGGLGQSVASEAMTAAIEQARSQPVVTCLLRRSGHLSAIGQFALQAAEQGMIALICQETPPLMALRGSSRPSIGNNPIAFAAPVSGQAPLVFDMATSVVARGNVLDAIREGRPSLPEGWAIGPDGEPTCDPAQALKGAMLPIAGHKGIGLAMMVQVLAGSLSASTTAQSAATHAATSSAGNVSAFILVINPDLVIGRDTFDAHMHAWIDTYKNASGAGGRYPGERAAEIEAQRLRDGIPLASQVVAELQKVGESVGHAFTVQPR
ncbi:Ldh family oxidoreductase [Pseudomonas sp. ML96]|uniref:Ldh family oxidoreductase n=1 Tax=Pseudomonas sp. ML96 TaxID=1523503 RepID=UPI00068CF6C0|nr:Ldh family oxidoreductase [Pseudomonas sp. ML96]